MIIINLKPKQNCKQSYPDWILTVGIVMPTDHYEKQETAQGEALI
jgi:hypothetical protein